VIHTNDVPQFQNRTEGVLDPEIITWCKDNNRVWITHDFEARRKHIVAIKTARINVVWIRVTTVENENMPGQSATWRIFKVIVRTIDESQRLLQSSHGAIHFRISLKSSSRPTIDWAESSYDRPRGYDRN
jgi:predicted nuclease of predicted toxin-antitoxin system